MKVLVINPGATSTKIAVYDEENEVFKTSVDHSAQELSQFPHIVDQADYREGVILNALKEAGYDLAQFDAVCGRGGLFRPIVSGTYAVNDAVIDTIRKAPYGEHASNLGAFLAKKLGDRVNIPSYFVDPVCVDEMTEVAHYTGFAPMRRLCQFHALNQKGMGRKAAAQLGKKYEECNFIICHLGGGVSTGAHQKGRVVDVCNVRDDGSMGMDRGGGLPVNAVVDYCFSGKTKAEVKQTLGHESGMFSYLGTTDFRTVEDRVKAGDEAAVAAYNALVYQMSKDIGSMGAVLRYDVDAIVLTGGMAYSKMFCDDIESFVGKLAPVMRLPGEAEMLSLAQGALRVLHGEKEALVY